MLLAPDRARSSPVEEMVVRDGLQEHFSRTGTAGVPNISSRCEAERTTDAVDLPQYPLTSLQVGDIQSYLHRGLWVIVDHDKRRLICLVDNGPISGNLQRSKGAQVWQRIVQQSRRSPFSNRSELERARARSQALRRRASFDGNSSSAGGSPLSESPLVHPVGLQALKGPARKLHLMKWSNSIGDLLEEIKERWANGLLGCVAFEVEWEHLLGMNYLNELQTDACMAVEASVALKREFQDLPEALRYYARKTGPTSPPSTLPSPKAYEAATFLQRSATRKKYHSRHRRSSEGTLNPLDDDYPFDSFMSARATFEGFLAAAKDDSSLERQLGLSNDEARRYLGNAWEASQGDREEGEDAVPRDLGQEPSTRSLLSLRSVRRYFKRTPSSKEASDSDLQERRSSSQYGGVRPPSEASALTDQPPQSSGGVLAPGGVEVANGSGRVALVGVVEEFFTPRTNLKPPKIRTSGGSDQGKEAVGIGKGSKMSWVGSATGVCCCHEVAASIGDKGASAFRNVRLSRGTYSGDEEVPPRALKSSYQAESSSKEEYWEADASDLSSSKPSEGLPAGSSLEDVLDRRKDDTAIASEQLEQPAAAADPSLLLLPTLSLPGPALLSPKAPLNQRGDHSLPPPAEVYNDVLLILRFQDPFLPEEFRRMVVGDPQLLPMLESGLPSWAMFLQSYPVARHLYRPWMRRVSGILYFLISAITVLIGCYDLYKNLPFVKEALHRLFGPVYEWFEGWNVSARLSYMGAVLCLQNFQRAFQAAQRVFRSLHYAGRLVARPIAEPLAVLWGFLRPLWTTLGGGAYWLAYSVGAGLHEVAEGVLSGFVLILQPVVALLGTLWHLIMELLCPVWTAVWAVLSLPYNLVLAFSTGVASVVLSFASGVWVVWRNLIGAFQYLRVDPRPAFAGVKAAQKASKDTSLWLSLYSAVYALWKDLFSKVFYAAKGVVNGILTFFIALNRHRLSTYNWFVGLLLQWQHQMFQALALVHHKMVEVPVSATKDATAGFGRAAQGLPDTILRKLRRRESRRCLSVGGELQASDSLGPVCEDIGSSGVTGLTASLPLEQVPSRMRQSLGTM